MTFHEARLSLQVVAERSFGAPMRQAAYEAKAREDAAAMAAAQAVEGSRAR